MSFRYESNTTLSQIATELGAAQNVLITTHGKPDGDAIGSCTALGQALKKQGKRVMLCLIPPVAGHLAGLAEGLEVCHRAPEDAQAPMPFEPDRIVVLDTGAWKQLEAMQPWLEPRRDRTILIDHHLQGNDVAALRYIETKAAAAAEIVAELLDEMGTVYDLQISTALYVGIATDTGWFRFSNTRPATHELAARLIREGVQAAELYLQCEQNERPEKLPLMARALGSIEMLAGGAAAVMTLRLQDFVETGARQEDTERFVDLPQIVGVIRTVVLLTETDEGHIRMSFRSKPGPGAIDVNNLARQFGGGGHARAAGAKPDGPIDAVKQRLRTLLEAQTAAV